MASFGSKGKWEASSITNNDIQELKRAGYLLANVAHRASVEGQVIAMHRLGERVVFVPPSSGG